MAYPTKRDTIAVVLTQNIDLNVDGGGLLVQLTGDGFTGTVDFQATVDGATYYNVPYQNRASLTAGTSVSQISSPSTATLYFIPGPLGQVRIAVTRSAGTVTVVYRTVGPEQLIIANATGVLVDTELPAAAALADGASNPTTPTVGAGVLVWNGTTWNRARSHLTADSNASPVTGLQAVAPVLFNGTSYDRMCGNGVELTSLASAARTATATSSSHANMTGRGIIIMLRVTAQSGGQINSVELYDAFGGGTHLLAQFASLAITTTGNRHFLVYPGAASAGSYTAAPIQGVVPRSFILQVTHGNTDSITYSLTYDLVV